MCASTGDCTQAAPLSGAGPKCIVGSASVQGTMMCSLACNPVAAMTGGCPSPAVCHVFSVGGEHADCSLPGSGADGASCTSGTDCIAGYGCFGNGGQLHCRPVCRAGTDADCTIGGETCHAITGFTAFGGCCPAAGC